MTISFVPIDVRSSDKADFVQFLAGNAFPFHVHPHPSLEQIATAIDGGHYDGDDHDALWPDVRPPPRLAVGHDDSCGLGRLSSVGLHRS